MPVLEREQSQGLLSQEGKGDS